MTRDNTAFTHVLAGDARQVEIYRRMTPSQRLEQAMIMNRQMRELMDSGLSATQPQLSADEATERGLALGFGVETACRLPKQGLKSAAVWRILPT